MTWLTELLQSLPVVLGGIAAAIAVLLVLVAVLLRRARREAEVTDTEAAAAAPDLVVVDFRSSAAAASLRRSFRRALATLDRSLPRPQPRYKVPWYLAVGEESAGKTTLLGLSGLEEPLGGPAAGPPAPTAGCELRFFDRAVALDPSGELVLRSDGRTSDQAGWRELLRLLRRGRPRRPLDGILLTLPAGELREVAAAGATGLRAAAERAEALHRKLWQAQRRLGFQLPVYLVVTKCDLLPGFEAFAGALPPEGRRQIFGWSNPRPVDTPYSGGWIEEAVESAAAAAEGVQLASFGGSRRIGDVTGFTLFPAEIAALEEALAVYANHLFAETAFHEPFLLRGIYFTGGLGFPEAEAPAAIPASPGEVVFAADLFRHKVLYEWNLAAPTERARRRSRHRLFLAQAALAAVVVAGTLGAWWGRGRVAAEAEELEPFLHRVAGMLQAQQESGGRRTEPETETPEGGAEPGPALAAQTRELLEAAGRLPGYRLESTFLPASWWNAAGREVGAAVTAAYERVAFPAMLRALGERGSRLSESPVPPAPARRGKPILSLEDVPELVQLQGYVGEVTALERGVADYDCIARTCTWSGAGLRRRFEGLAAYLYALNVRPPTRRSRELYGQVLKRVDIPPAPEIGGAEEMGDRSFTLAEAAYEGLFNLNALSRDLDHLALELGRLGWVYTTPRAAEPAYRRVVELIDRTQRHLADPRFAWAGGRQLDLGRAHERLLAAVGDSAVLGPAVSARMRRTAEELWEPFRWSLEDYETSYTGRLLAQADDAVVLELAPTVVELRGALRSLLAQDFFQPASGSPGAGPAAGVPLAWDLETLEEVAALFPSYEEFSTGELESFPESLRPVIRSVARNCLASNTLARVETARVPATGVGGFTARQREEVLEARVENLSAATPTLREALDRLAGLGLDAAYMELAAVIEIHQHQLLSELDVALQAQGLYLPAAGSISRWQGEPGLTGAAFGAEDAEGLDGYLAAQRGTVSRLARRYAEPVLAASGGREQPQGEAGEPFARWQLVLSDLEGYDEEKPGNPLAGLEGFVASTMPELTVETCLGEALPDEPCHAGSTPAELRQGGCDFFLARRASLQQDIHGRCLALVEIAGYRAYLEIEEAFELLLRGRFPFAPPEPGRAEATPAAIRAFFEVFDRHAGIVGQVPEGSARFGPALADVREFMRQVAEVRELFAAFLADADEEAVPTWDFEVEFRVARDDEEGGENVIGWSFGYGERTIRRLDGDRTGRWSPDVPVSLTLRWAEDSPVVPVALLDGGAGRLDGRTAVYRYDNRWSLLRLLAEHPSSRRDFGSYEPRPETLKLVAATRETAGDEPAAASPDWVFLRITLTTPDETKRALPVPAFPAAAPRVDGGEGHAENAAEAPQGDPGTADGGTPGPGGGA